MFQNLQFHCYWRQSNCELWNENHEVDIEVRSEICELRFQVTKAFVGIACAEGSESGDLKSWLSTFKHQLDSETFTCIYETLKANQFCNRLKIKLTREEEFNLIFNKQLPLGAKALLQYQISLLREQSPLQKPTASRVREEKEDTSAKNTQKR